MSAAPLSACGRVFVRLVAMAALTPVLMGADGLQRLTPEPARAVQTPAQVSARSAQPPDTGTPAFAVISRQPDAQIKFHGIYLKDAQQNPGRNQLSLQFRAPVGDGLFEQLPDVLPDWITFAYADGATALIGARDPATFTATPVPDGFVLRIAPRDEADHLQRLSPGGPGGPPELGRSRRPGTRLIAVRAAPLRLRPALEARPEDWRETDHYHAVAEAELGALRGPLDSNAVRFETGTTWHHARGQDVATASASGEFPIYNGIAMIGDLTARHVTGKSIQRRDNSYGQATKTLFGGAAGFAYRSPGGAKTEVAALYSPVGVGARLSYDGGDVTAHTQFYAAYHEAYGATAAAVVQHAFKDEAELRHEQHLFSGLWAGAAMRFNRYGFDNNRQIATTAGFSADLRFVQPVFGWALGVNYQAEGEYILDTIAQPGVGGPFVPLGIRNREVHSLSLSASGPVGGGFWLDSYGGWAIDRYGTNGPFGGLSLHYTTQGIDIAAGIAHSQVPGHEGETGATTTAGLNLSIALQPSG